MLQKIPFLPGINKQLTPTGAEFQWVDCDNVRFRYTTPEKIGGWKQLGADNVIDEYKNIHKPGAPKGVEVNLKPGDMLIYSGCELEHWREPFKGKLCGQVFLHYNHADGRFAKTNLYDKRPMLGIVK